MKKSTKPKPRAKRFSQFSLDKRIRLLEGEAATSDFTFRAVAQALRELRCSLRSLASLVCEHREGRILFFVRTVGSIWGIGAYVALLLILLRQP